MNAYVRILFFAANPLSSTRLALDEEYRDIKAKLRASEHRDRFHLAVSLATRPADLHQELLEQQPTIVHFSGHGSGEPGLVFAGDRPSEEKLVSGDALRQLFSVLRDNVRVVVLNACYSDEQAKAIVEEIDFVIGMKDSIGDRAAQLFAASFYQGLGFGRTIQASFDLGINAIKLEGLVRDQDVPVLMQREGAAAKEASLVGKRFDTTPGRQDTEDGLLLDVGRIYGANESSPHCVVHVTVSAGSEPVKLSELRAKVLESRALDQVSTHVPAAPVTERCLFGRLTPVGTENILPTPHVLQKGDTDGFLIKFQGEEGTLYVAEMELHWKLLGGNSTHSVTVSRPFELLFPVRSVAGMLTLLSEGGGE